jgi:hypothetical protein
MGNRLSWPLACADVLALPICSPVFAAIEVPDPVKMPGTQPQGGIVAVDDVTVCANCHGNYRRGRRTPA